jgi:hypothetical protein
LGGEYVQAAGLAAVGFVHLQLEAAAEDLRAMIMPLLTIDLHSTRPSVGGRSRRRLSTCTKLNSGHLT